MRRLGWLLLPLCLALVPRDRPVSRLAPPPSNWADTGTPLPTPDEFARWADTDPVALLDACLRRSRREVKSFRATLHKQEAVRGSLHAPEVIDVSWRAEPAAALFRWRAGQRRAVASLYAADLFPDQVLVQPAGLLGTLGGLKGDGLFLRDLSDPLVRAESRYTIAESGLHAATERSWRAWARAKQLGRLQTVNEGRRPCPEVGGRECFVLRRSCDPPEEEGLLTVRLLIDAETWLQVGSHLSAGERLIGRYDFRAVELNPPLANDHFTRANLAR